MENLNFIKNKILITNHHLINFAGSELTTFYLAKEFQSYGYDVNIATFSFGYPIKSIFEENNIKVFNILNDDLPHNSYDIIWSHHSPVLLNCLFEKNITSKNIIFSSLSSFEPLEAPPVFINLLSLCLANSCETRDYLIEEGVSNNKVDVFFNSVDDNFLNQELTINNRPELNKICIISNHVPEELLSLQDLFCSMNISCDYYGINNKFEIITPELLNKYDSIVTIGRTVQYGLSLGIPVYCYDRFGGPGWITPENIDSAEYYNFSGRCCKRKLSSIEIFDEIINNYHTAFSNRIKLQSIAKERYSLKKNIVKVLNYIENYEIDYNSIIFSYKMEKRINEYYTRELKATYSKDETIINMKQQLISLNQELNNIYKSKRWKIANALYKIKNFLLFFI